MHVFGWDGSPPAHKQTQTADGKIYGRTWTAGSVHSFCSLVPEWNFLKMSRGGAESAEGWA